MNTSEIEGIDSGVASERFQKFRLPWLWIELRFGSGERVCFVLFTPIDASRVATAVITFALAQRPWTE
jgi:hypothetical protein